MQKRWTSTRNQKARALPLAALLTGLLAAPGVGAEIYAWRTEDGGYAYTDDADQVPPRYAAEAQVRGEASLNDYERYTATDPAASSRYADRMAARLRYLRALNSAPVAAPAAQRSRGVRSIAVATGNPQAPTVNIESEHSGAPIVVDPVYTIDPGSAVTRRTTLVRQGDRTIAVLKGRSHETDLGSDVYKTSELGRDE
ncbi:MAG: hypothetical protein OEM49_15115 [Myxococcales bacterium]|nr:hypothetical protein [Myxococcales bacterium]MDH5306167.1 hypothetical protein [Myxococcales bacterium]MDH5567779.1 hypothetical protein [Myxococcales bacterium]